MSHLSDKQTSAPWWEISQQLQAAREQLAKRLADTEAAVLSEWAKQLCEQVKDAPDQYELHIRRYGDEVVYSFEPKGGPYGRC